MNLLTGEMGDSKKLNTLLSQARSFIMGVAMLLIMLFHNAFGALGKVERLFSIYGHWGVDIFIFLSGFGLYHALARTKGTSIKNFYLRRLTRLMPAAVPAGVCLYVLGYASWWGLAGLNLWYVRTILVLYLIAPVVYNLIIRYSPGYVVAGGVYVSTLGVLIGKFLLSACPPEVYTALVWTLARLSAFVIGLCIARVNWDVKALCNWRYILFCVVGLAALLYLHYLRYITGSFSDYLHLLPYVLLSLIIPGCCLVLAVVYRVTPDFIRKIVIFFGTYSLEIYLVHEAIFKAVAALDIAAGLKLLLAYGVSAILALVLHYVAVWVLRAVRALASLRCA